MSEETKLVFSEDFTITCGTVVVKRSTQQVLVLFRGTEDAQTHTLPKGRKQIDTTLAQTAVNETFKETGYKCSILPLDMDTRATPQVQIGYTPDKPQSESNCVEPVAVTYRETSDGYKQTFWFAAALDESVEQDLSTDISSEKFNAQFFNFAEAAKLLSFEHERQIVERVAILYSATYRR